MIFILLKNVFSSTGSRENTKISPFQYNVSFYPQESFPWHVPHKCLIAKLAWQAWPMYAGRIHGAIPAMLKKLYYCIRGIMGQTLVHHIFLMRNFDHFSECDDMNLQTRGQSQYKDVVLVVSWPSCPLHGKPHTGERRSLFWDRAQLPVHDINGARRTCIAIYSPCI